ncbi:MAG: CoB--CoM heterodisulfide reductase iron-sulfur subunit B family protein [Candidatus Helarchaeales archaeon]
MPEYALFLGCLIPYQFPQMELAARKLYDKFGYILKDIEGAGCCPDPVTIQSADYMTWVTLAARNISLAEEMGLDILALCSGCFETLHTVNQMLKKDEKLKKEVNEVLKEIGREYKGSIEVKHSFHVIYREIGIEKIKESIIRPLNGLRVGLHYGCHLVRPNYIVQFDDPEAPRSMHEVLEVIGAKAIDYPYEMNCCGSCITKTDPMLGYRLGKEKLMNLKKYHADCMSLVCPCCYQQFDGRQPIIKRHFSELDFNMPILSMEELICLAIGLSPDELGFKFHRVKVDSVLEKIEGKEQAQT